MNGTFLEEVTEERDLGFTKQNDFKCSSHCIKFKTANRVPVNT